MYRALRRHYNRMNAFRKKRICTEVYGHEYYEHLHQYSKNKVHCSCPLCAEPKWHNYLRKHNCRAIAKMNNIHDRRRLTDMIQQEELYMKEGYYDY